MRRDGWIEAADRGLDKRRAGAGVLDRSAVPGALAGDELRRAALHVPEVDVVDVVGVGPAQVLGRRLEGHVAPVRRDRRVLGAAVGALAAARAALERDQPRPVLPEVA